MSEILDNDNIQFDDDDSDDLSYISNINSSKIYQSMRVTKRDFSIYELFRKFNNGQLILDIDFQRRKVWSRNQDIELIESIFMGLPLPIFYFKQKEQGEYIVVDGEQRLSAIFNYMKNKFSLDNLQIMQHLNKKKFLDLVNELGIYKNQLEDYQIYSHVILPPTPDKILFDIFDRVNRGGTKLNKQEIRNALYHGPGLHMIDEINKNEIFEKATRISYTKDSRMKGSYLLTRFFAFLLLRECKLRDKKNIYTYRGDYDELFEKTLRQLNDVNIKYLEELKEITLDCLEKSTIILGKDAFRREMNSSNPINMNIFETTMYFFYKIKNYRIYDAIQIKKYLFELIKNKDYLKYIERGRMNPEYVKNRFDMIDNLAEKILRGDSHD